MKRTIVAVLAAAVLAGCGGAAPRPAASPSSAPPVVVPTSTALTLPSRGTCTTELDAMLQSIVTGLQRQERLMRRAGLPAHTALSIAAGAWGGLGIYRARLARFIHAEAGVTASQGGVGPDVAQAVSDGRALLVDASSGQYAGGHLKMFREDIGFLAGPTARCCPPTWPPDWH